METTDFHEIFARIKDQLMPFAGEMEVRIDTPGAYQLYIVKDIVLAGRPFTECYFGGTVIQKSMVAFYCFPIYSHPGKLTIPESIQKNLKGKSCFNFKKLSSEQEQAIAVLLQEGAALYKQLHIL